MTSGTQLRIVCLLDLRFRLFDCLAYLHWAVIPNTPKVLWVIEREVTLEDCAFSHTSKSSTSWAVARPEIPGVPRHPRHSWGWQVWLVKGPWHDNSGSEMTYNFAIGISHYPICTHCQVCDMNYRGICICSECPSCTHNLLFYDPWEWDRLLLDWYPLSYP